MSESPEWCNWAQNRIVELESKLDFLRPLVECKYNVDKPVRPGLDPTFYNTLNYEDEVKLINQIKKVLEK